MKADALSHIRHELRTPINAIVGYSDMLLEDADDPPIADELAEIHQAGRDLLRLVNQYLAADGGQDGNGEPDWEAVRRALQPSLNAVIARSETLAAVQLPDDFGKDIRRIRLAGNRFRECLDQFSRRESGSAAPEAAAHPVVKAGNVDWAPALSRQKKARQPASKVSGREANVLVVDDNETNRDILVRHLEKRGYASEEASDGRRALARLEQAPFDLVLLDVMMPGMDGYEVLERMKNNVGLRHIPVIMISALDELESVVRCIETGAEDYLPKPFDPVLLDARVGACLEKKRLRDREQLYLQQIEAEKKRTDELLHVILPEETVHELKTTGRVKPRRHEDVAVLFCDIVGFTPYCETHDPQDVVEQLQEMVESFEDIVLHAGMQKIKTIGDAFMATAGLTKEVPNPVLSGVACGLQMLSAVHRLSARWEARVGIHVGPVISGVIGQRQYLYDVWGDTVNTAARVESHGSVGTVNLTAEAWQRVADLCEGGFEQSREVKGKGELEIYRVDGLTAATSNNGFAVPAGGR